MKYSLWVSCLVLLFWSCHDETPNQYPIVITGEVTDVGDAGAVFHGKILDLVHQNLLEYGFVWDTILAPEIEISQRFSIGKPAREGVFSQQISTTLAAGNTYSVRAYLLYDQYITYGKAVSFDSQGSLSPTILDFYPKKGNLGDTLSLLGRNFSYLNETNEIELAGFKAEVIFAHQDSLQIIVPHTLNRDLSLLTVSISNRKITFQEPFALIAPETYDFEQKIASFGQKLNIAGKPFMSNPASLKVYFNDIKAEIVSITDQQLEVLVPDSLDSRQAIISVEMNNLTAKANGIFTLSAMEFDDFIPKTILSGEVVTITGQNFSPIVGNNLVTIGGLEAEVLSVENDEMQVRIPSHDTGFFHDRKVLISISTAGREVISSDTLLIDDPWFRLPDYPGDYPDFATCIYHDGKAYIGLSGSPEFWQFDPSQNSWKKLADFPGVVRTNGSGFNHNGHIYFGTGIVMNRENMRDFWKYSIADDRWIQLDSFPGKARYGAIGFTIGNKSYLIGGVEYKLGIYTSPFEETWEYDHSTDRWSQIASFGDLNRGNDGFAQAGVCVIGERAYFGLGWNRTAYPRGSSERMFVFEPLQNNLWTQVKSFPEERYNRPLSFTLQGIPYFLSDKRFYGYNGEWVSLETKILSDINGGIAFSHWNKAYVGLGIEGTFWEYDPGR